MRWSDRWEGEGSGENAQSLEPKKARLEGEAEKGRE